VQTALDLPSKALEASWECLRRVGNLSSASVLCVLEDFLNNRRGEPGTYSILAAMGPGFCSEVVLLKWGLKNEVEGLAESASPAGGSCPDIVVSGGGCSAESRPAANLLPQCSSHPSRPLRDVSPLGGNRAVLTRYLQRDQAVGASD